MPGLYDGDFVGYRVASGEDLEAALREAVVAVDANVLLSLYRLRVQTARDLLEILERLGDRLVVPHQAVREFWRHRQRAPGSPNAAMRTALERLDKGAQTMVDALETWAKQVGLEAGERVRLTDQVRSSYDEVAAAIGDPEEAGSEAEHGDPILEWLERLLDGRVTSALNQDEWQRCVAEGRRRVECQEPPGYRDAGKTESNLPEGPAGDYLVWYQAAAHAKERDSDLLFVTADEKEDWWWRQRGAPVGPRPELSLEFYTLTGRRLFMIRPPDLLARGAALDVDVNENSVADAERNAAGEASNAFAQLTTHMDELAEDLGLAVKAGKTGRNYQPPDREPGVQYASGVGVYSSGRGTEFNLSAFRDLGQDAIADDLLQRIREVTGETVTAGLWPAVPCESLTRDWRRTRDELMEPYFTARARLRDV